MSFFTAVPYSGEFQYLEWDVTEQTGNFRFRFPFDGSTIGDRWEPPEEESIYVERPLKPAPDIWGGPFTIYFESHVVDALRDILAPVGELLPLQFEGRPLYALNVTYVPDVLDLEHTAFHPQDAGRITRHAFHAERLEHSLFKIPQERWGSLFVTEGLLPAREEFKSRVEEFGFRGLYFSEIPVSRSDS